MITKAISFACAITASAVAFLTLSIPASAVPQQASHPFANSCNLPTHADPGDGWYASYTDCNQCLFWANVHSTNHDTHYCTYNPSNGLTDEHFHIF
jgi:hypothetical protein